MPVQGCPTKSLGGQAAGEAETLFINFLRMAQRLAPSGGAPTRGVGLGTHGPWESCTGGRPRCQQHEAGPLAGTRMRIAQRQALQAPFAQGSLRRVVQGPQQRGGQGAGAPQQEVKAGTVVWVVEERPTGRVRSRWPGKWEG